MREALEDPATTGNQLEEYVSKHTTWTMLHMLHWTMLHWAVCSRGQGGVHVMCAVFDSSIPHIT